MQKDNVIRYLKEIECGIVDRIYLAQGLDQLRVFMNDNEQLGSIKTREFLDQLRDY
jgi:hypothetical protein